MITKGTVDVVVERSSGVSGEFWKSSRYGVEFSLPIFDR